ncbi:MAG: YceI family protein [Balneolaceae bacterium]|nr:YceI family protein [Balneolaceae bacterium]
MNSLETMFNHLALVFFLFLLAGTSTTFGQVYQTENGHVEFHSEVPLHSFTGESDKLVGRISLADSTVDFYVDMYTIDTGVSKRNKDMRETLNVEKYPFAEFFGKLVTPFDPNNEGKQPATVEGEFSVHGVTNKVTVEGTLEMTDSGLRVQAAWTLNIEEYDIEPPGILFYRVDENQDIEIDALLKPTETADSN